MSACFLDGNALKQIDQKNLGTEGGKIVFSWNRTERTSELGGVSAGYVPISMYLYTYFVRHR